MGIAGVPCVFGTPHLQNGTFDDVRRERSAFFMHLHTPSGSIGDLLQIYCQVSMNFCRS